jgi:hypothetical protein
VCRARNQLSTAPSEVASLPEVAACAVEVALGSGSMKEARESAEALLIAAERFGAPGTLGIAQRLLGLAAGGTGGLDC